MNWDNIKVFAAIAKLGSIGQAANELEINHSTVLRRISSLEQELGVSLFHRRQSGYEITVAGEHILAQAIKMEDEATTLQRLALAADEAGRGRLRLTIPPDYFIDLMPMLVDFQQQHPDIALDVEAMLELRDLDEMEADVSIRFTNTPPSHYVGREVLKLPLNIYASRAYLAERSSIESVGDADWIIMYTSNTPDAMEQWLKAIDPEVNIIMKLNTASMAMEAIEHGVGMGFLPQHLAETSKHLEPVELMDVDISVGLWVLTHSDLRYQPRIKKFVDFIRQRLELRYPDYKIKI